MAIDSKIQQQLERVARRQQRLELWAKLAMCWGLAALIGLAVLVLQRESGWTSSLAAFVIGLIGVGAGVAVLVRQSKRAPAWRELARKIEARKPALAGRLLTAVQQETGAGGELNYLQQRLVRETLEYSRRSDWADTISQSRVNLAQTAHWLALGVFVVVLIGLRGSGGQQLLGGSPASAINVTPGDVNLERGSSLVVLARFKGALPPSVELAFGQPPALQRVPLVKSLGDPMFGGRVPEVASNFVYHVEYGGQRTRDFNVTVFEHPRLERADAEVTYPDYTAKPPKRIENTRRLSAVEGSRVDLTLQFNKPVASAQFFTRDKDRTPIPLAVEGARPAATLKQFSLDATGTYDLQLVDVDGRTNKIPAEFVFEVLKNRPPELRLTSPRGDLRPSPLEEIAFDGTVWDDFGVRAFGLAYAVNGQNPNFVELGADVPGNEKRSFHHILRLEDLGVEVDQLVSWFVWADDLGPDAKVRRTMGDLYFGEVRPFEEIFREGQDMGGQAGGGGESGEGDRTGRLVDLQKQIVNATWKLQREHPRTAGSKPKRPDDYISPRRESRSSGDQSLNSPRPPRRNVQTAAFFGAQLRVAGQVISDGGWEAGAEQSRQVRVDPASQRASLKGQAPKYEEDAGVVLDSQAQALEQAQTALERQREPQAAGLWQKAVSDMREAMARLQAATNSPAALADALASEQAAYQALLRLQEHEYQVSRSRNRNQGGSSRNQQLQRQLEEMDFTQSENRYENLREAQRAQNPERREQLQIMSRLQELARRQQDLDERLKELQTALQEARSEQERAEIQRQLKRLQEEEQQMLADVDEVRQRMDRPENQSRMADQRRQLDQTRQEVQRAAEAAGQGAAAQALAAGTRAQNQLQQLRDQVRKENSSQFADDLRDMRNQARELARQQEEILKKIQSERTSERKSLAGSGGQEETLARLSRQQEVMTNLVGRATQVSQQAEEAEPLLSHQLYDTVRKFTQDTAKDLKEMEGELLNRGPMTRSLFDLLRDDSEQGAVKLEQITSEMLRLGHLTQASQAGEKARASIENLKKGVERAAESVIGDDTEALQLAQRQLNDLARQLQREIAEGQGKSATNLEPNSEGEQSGGSRQQGALAVGGAQPQERADARASRGTAQAGGATAGDLLNSGSAGGAGGGARNWNWDRLREEGARRQDAPITGEDFASWSDRLREVEEMIEQPDLRDDVAKARERARLFRQDFKRERKKPDWAVVQLQVMKPLNEVRDRIADELARRESREALVPLDRDPVPNRYSELVRRYYEELGKQK